MKILVFSNDSEIIKLIRNIDLIEWAKGYNFILKGENNPLEVLSIVCQERPFLLIFDDDFLRPNSAQVLRNIKKLHEKVKVIFVTSDSSLEIGREVTQLGIHYYVIKPLESDDFRETLRALLETKEKNYY